MIIKVEQQLHGYRRGHERLTGSIKLSASDAELVDRLSDLSGTLAGNQNFRPYVTVYPLPSGKYYAVATTWSDVHAVRSGCVLTQTLLISMNEWRIASQPSELLSLFKNPLGRTSDSTYEASLTWPTAPDLTPTKPFNMDMSHVDFVHRYFAEGKQPIIWFGNSDPEATLWPLLKGLWPALRGRFACCTLSLQPRTLVDRSFDLMFAPAESYPRFLRIKPNHLVDASKVNPAANTDGWHRRWAERLFEGVTTYESLEGDLWKTLDEDPTAIRRLYLIDTAMRSKVATPQEAVGAMDLVESVARSAHAAIRTKVDVALRAINAALISKSTPDGLESLRLINDRCMRMAYSQAAIEIGPSITEAVAAYTLRDPELVAKTSQGNVDSNSDDGVSWYGRGLIEGFRKLASDAPTRLVALKDLPVVIEKLLKDDSGLSAPYVEALFERRSESGVRHALIDFLATERGQGLPDGLSRSFLSRLEPGDHALLRVILTRTSDDDVATTMNSLRSNLSDDSLASVVVGWAIPTKAIQLRLWAATISRWDGPVAKLVAATYPDTRKGLLEILDDEHFDSTRRSALLIAFLVRFGSGKSAAWLRDIAQTDHRFLQALVSVEGDGRDFADTTVQKLLRECPELPLAHFSDVRRLLFDLQSRPYFDEMFDITLRDLVRGYVAGTVVEEDALPLLLHPDSVKWLGLEPVTHFR